MKKYIFNRDEFTWAEEFYEIIKKKMGLPDYFGCNADALWDMLTGYIDTPCEIVLVGFGKEENVYNRNFLQRIISCFEDAAKEYPEQFKLTKIAYKSFPLGSSPNLKTSKSGIVLNRQKDDGK